MNNVFQNRVNTLKQFLNNADEAILLTNDINIGYFSGFQHSEGVMLITSENAYLLVDFRYIEAAQNTAESCKVICFKKLTQDICEICSSESIKNIYLESTNVTLARFNAFKSEFEKHKITSFSDDRLDALISQIRCIKDDLELQKISQAQAIAEKSYLEVLNDVRVGAKEKDISARLEYLMKLYGAQKASFDLITISGKKTSLPHGVPSDNEIKAGDFFTCDFGAVYDGYCSDTTRTVAVKYADDVMQSVYDTVLKAQLKALDAVKPNVTCCDVDKAARDVIEQAGYGEFFGHATGHGVGLEIHELPTVSFRDKAILKAGMVITDEPGIYLPERFGVRIEDMLCVTETGYRNFVNLPKELIIV